MATVWAISDHGAGEWARDALRRAGHVVLGANIDVALAWLDMELRPDIAVIDLDAAGAFDLAALLGPVRTLCLGRPGDIVDRALANLITNGAPCVPNAPGHELELVGAVQLQLERAGVTDV